MLGRQAQGAEGRALHGLVLVQDVRGMETTRNPVGVRAAQLFRPLVARFLVGGVWVCVKGVHGVWGVGCGVCVGVV